MKKNIKIGDKYIGQGQPVFIIAEAGVNHNGSVKLAKKLVDFAMSAGADAIKFQTFKTEELVIYNAPKANYQKKTTSGESQFNMLKKLELSESTFKELFDYCKKKKIIFLSSPFDNRSAEFLYKLRVPLFKIGSGELTNIPLLLKIAKYRKPIILSTGMATMREVEEAVKVIYSAGNRKLILLHCTTDYPAKYEDINLKAMEALRKKFKIPIGYSDHTKGIEVSIGAVSMGACVIEKHFTLNRNLHGPDHRASLEPWELREMVKCIRHIERAMGDGVKKPQKSEEEIKKVVRKSIVVAVDIPKGQVITSDMLAIKRPGTGIEPDKINKLVGRQVRFKIAKDEVLYWDLLR